MRILVLCNKAPYPPDDGSSIAVCSLLEGLHASGASLHVLAINTSRHFKPDEGIPAELRSRWNYQSVYKDTRPRMGSALFNLFFSRTPYFASRFLFKSYEEVLLSLLQSKSFDIVHLEGLFMGHYISRIRQCSSALISYRAHNVEHKIWERYVKHEKNVLKKIYLSIQIRRLIRWEKKIINTVDALIPITGADAREIQKWIISSELKKRVLPVPAGIVAREYEYQKPSLHPVHLFFFGAMDWMPNVEAVRWFRDEIFPVLRKKIPSLQWTIAGRNMPEDIRTLRDPQIIIRESVPHKKEIFHSGNIMIVPLLSGSGLKIKILEGMAYGKCIVTTSIGAEGIDARHEKELFIADTPGEFIQILCHLYHHPERIEETGIRAREYALANYDRDAWGKSLYDFYSRLIQNRHGVEMG